MEEKLEQFKKYLQKIRHYEQALSLLQWDMQTQTPKKGMESKTEAIGCFSEVYFSMKTSAEYGEMLELLSAPAQFERLDEGMRATVRRYSRDYRRFARIPKDFYTEYVMTMARSEKAWEEAKRSAGFEAFLPHLDKMIGMTKQYAAYMEPGRDPYETLLEQHAEGMDSETIDRLFTQLKEGLLPLLKKISAAPKPDLSAFEGSFDIAGQKEIQKLLLTYIGFDFDAGITAESEHPFTMGLCRDDVRITNHFQEKKPLAAIFSAIHEGGHGIFEQSVDPAYAGTAVEEINLMDLHESQSRFYENILGRNKNFWLPVYDKMGGLLAPFKEIPLDVFYRAVNAVQPGLIRTESDEVTYCLHIILRFEMEKAIFMEQIPTEKLPALWNDKMEELLGIRPANDAEGILQDMHWSDGSFGYFPSYLLGSIYDGMLLNKIEEELGSLDAILAEGRIGEITKWLGDKIHRYGSLYNSREVIKRVCGCEVSVRPLLEYFNRKYADIYGF